MTNYSNLSADDIVALTMFFEYVDTDHDGYITIEEIRTACAVDYNSDGVIDQNELIRGGQIWIEQYLPSQDVNADSKITLEELLSYNNVV